MTSACVFVSNRVPDEGTTVGSEETLRLEKACKCFSRNSAQVNELNGVASKQNRNFRLEGKGSSVRRLLLPKRKVTF